MYGNWGQDMGAWAYTLIVMGVVFWGVLGLVAFALLRGIPNGGSHHEATLPQPERLLAQRYARGDVDEDEYRRRLAVPHDNAVNRKGG
ncbi:SHOCT domain-containing protein [Streptomyces kunmingensis]|uniref:SHOCT domain-containing protein n=1 Tax=Streptomyces kunmingensis TaxID=68225 RepID=A0ABU6CES3_9ACTN|nr:SHOCT domain-containing protein [Streptomyces kunmingensis]MEB3962691.1 SHOCT domain-containing protein [Streptomyces kunmingensis]